jgi:protein TonB
MRAWFIVPLAAGVVLGGCDQIQGLIGGDKGATEADSAAPAPEPARPAPPPLPTIGAEDPGCATRIESRVTAGPPRYPSAELARGVAGKAVLAHTINPDGSVSDVGVVTSEPTAAFGASAVRAVAQWTYAPDTAAGTLRHCRVELVFELDAEPAQPQQ